jgi:hypothetical protein
MKKNYFVAFIIAAIIPIIIVVALLLNNSKINNADTKEGESYLVSLDRLDAESVEESILNNTTETTYQEEVSTTVPPETDPTVPSVEDTTPAPPPETTVPPVEKPTEPPYVPSNNSCYVPYQVNAEDAAATYNKYINGEISMRELFANTAFVGDSVMTGFDVYFGMPLNVNVFASVGASMKSHMPTVINGIISTRPKYILIRYGLNEMELDEYIIKVFMENYKQYIKQLKDALPDSKIIILGLSPVGQAAINKSPRFGNVPRYNAGFRAIAEELGVGYYENSDLFYANSDKMGKDGIHFQKSLYEIWIKDMVKEMGIY